MNLREALKAFENADDPRVKAKAKELIYNYVIEKCEEVNNLTRQVNQLESLLNNIGRFSQLQI